ncbi:hypothetical protein ACFX19_043269 [Malus domestica]
MKEKEREIQYYGGGVEVDAGASDGDRGFEVELHGVIELVGVDAIDLPDVEVVVGGELVENLVEELGEGVAEL